MLTGPNAIQEYTVDEAEIRSKHEENALEKVRLTTMPRLRIYSFPRIHLSISSRLRIVFRVSADLLTLRSSVTFQLRVDQLKVRFQLPHSHATSAWVPLGESSRASQRSGVCFGFALLPSRWSRCLVTL